MQNLVELVRAMWGDKAATLYAQKLLESETLRAQCVPKIPTVIGKCGDSVSEQPLDGPGL